MLSELNENRGRQLNKIKENNFLKMRILTGIQIIKKNQTNSGAQKYHNWIEKFTTGVQHQTWSGRRKNLNLKTDHFKLLSQMRKKKKEWRKWTRLKDLWDTIKWTNVCTKKWEYQEEEKEDREPILK